jgi:SNF2 family DNA or RNA helicase
MKTKPYEHQQECFDLIKDKEYYGLFAEPGLGKTKIALDVISYHAKSHKRYKALVVCPNTLVENWADEIEKHSSLPYILLLGSKAQRLKKLSWDSTIYVINYESTRILHKELRERGFDYLVLDESTAIKNFKSLQSKACYDISTAVTRRLIMSGTPVMNTPLDIFAQYKVLDPLIFGISFYRFRATYAVMGGFMNKQAIQWKNMDNFKRKVWSCAIRKTKDECLDLPDKLYQVINVDLTEEQKKVYKKLKEEFIYEFKNITVTAPIMLTRLMRFSQITAGFTKDIEGVEHEFKDNPKVAWLLDFINGLDSKSKVVVFCRFRREIRQVEDALRRNATSFVSVHGDTKDRIEKVREFNGEGDIRCFIGQLQTAGIGINLTSASYCVFMSNSYSYGERIPEPTE